MKVVRGIVRGFDAVNYRADVQLVGSVATYLPSIAVAKHIAAAEVIDGAECAVLFFDEANPSEAVVIATYGGAALVRGFSIPMEAFIPVEGSPTATTLGEASNAPRAWSLPDGSESGIGVWVAVPAEWGSGATLQVTVYYTAAATSGNCDFRIRYLAAAEGQDLTASPASITVLGAAPAAGNQRKSASADLTGIDGGDMLNLTVARAGNSAEDTLAAAVLVVGCSVARV